MSERKDDTTEQDEPSRPEKERQPGSYYYDDSTGYEIYDPAKDEEDEDEEDEDEREAGQATRIESHHQNRKGGAYPKRSPF